MHKLKIFQLLFVIPLLFTGCSADSGPSNIVKKVVKPASGKFMIDGVPPGKAGTDGSPDNPPHYHVIIKLYPKGRAVSKDDILPSAEVDPVTGNYSFATYTEGDGLPPGDYIMTFESLQQSIIGRYKIGPDRFKNNFNNPVTQDQKYAVKIDEASKENIELPQIDIKMSELTDQEPSTFATPSGTSDARRR